MVLQSFASFLDKEAGFTKLPDYIHSITAATLLCFVFQLWIGPAVSALLFPKTYPQLSLKTKHDWNVRFVAFVHAMYATVAAAGLLADPIIATTLKADKVFAFQPQASAVTALSTGYFLWDLVISTVYIHKQGLGFFLHALACFAVFFASFRPFLNYFGAIFLLWETSSIFLGIHWALDKLSLTGSLYQLINGVFLLLSFGGIRLVWGTFNSIDFFREISRPDVKEALPTGFSEFYIFALAVLQCLNAYWFYQMIQTIRKRFDTTEDKPKKQ